MSKGIREIEESSDDSMERERGRVKEGREGAKVDNLLILSFPPFRLLQ